MSEAVLGPKSAKYRVFCGYTWKTPVYLENTWVSCRFPQFCPRFCPRPALRLRETREFPEGNSRETEWSTKHPLVSLETSGNAKCWGPSGFPLGCRKPSDRPRPGPRGRAQVDKKVAQAAHARACGRRRRGGSAGGGWPRRLPKDDAPHGHRRAPRRHPRPQAGVASGQTRVGQ